MREQVLGYIIRISYSRLYTVSPYCESLSSGQSSPAKSSPPPPQIDSPCYEQFNCILLIVKFNLFYFTFKFKICYRRGNNFMDRKQSNLQIMEVTVEEVKVSIDKLAFKGGEDQFRAYAQALSPEAIKNALEAEFQLQGRTLEQNMEAEAQDDASGLSSLMITCQCCSFCPQDCAENFACCLCLLSCFVLMLFWWIICPIFYCCLKRKVERIATTSMTPSPYQTLQELGTRLKLKKIKISVLDNYLGKQKLEYISSFISGTGAKEFRFQNLAIALNGEDSEYDDFLDNTTVISKIPSLTYYMKWEDKVSTNI